MRVGAECLPPAAKFHVWGDGVTGPSLLGPRSKTRYEPSRPRLPLDANFINYPKEWEAQLAIKADAPLGPCFWRATTGWGGTLLKALSECVSAIHRFPYEGPMPEESK